MTAPADPFPAARSRTHLLLIVLILLLAAVRLRSFSERFEWDMGFYVTAGHEMHLGKQLYYDIWDIKPPAIFFTFYLVQFLPAPDHLHVYLLSVAAAAVTMLGVHKAASTAASPSAAAWAAIFWAAVCFEPTTDANLPNTEVFINAAAAWAFALWLRDDDERLRRWIAIGVLFAVASMYKHVAAAVAIVLAVAELLTARNRGRALAGIAVLASTAAILWLVLFAYFAATGRAWIFTQNIFVAPRAYAGSISHNLASIATDPAPWRLLGLTFPAAALTIVGLLDWRDSAKPRVWTRWIALLIGTHIALALPGTFASHYAQLDFVPLTIGAGLGAATLPRLLGRPRLAFVAATFCALAVVAPQISWYTMRDRWDQRKFRLTLFQWANDAILDAGRLLGPDETFYTWSDESWAYALIHKRPPATAIWRAHATSGPLARWVTQKSLAELRRNPPELIAPWGLDPQPADHPISRWIAANYHPLPGEGRKHLPMSLWIRRGGAVEHRLTAATSPATRGTSSAALD